MAEHQLSQTIITEALWLHHTPFRCIHPAEFVLKYAALCLNFLGSVVPLCQLYIYYSTYSDTQRGIFYDNCAKRRPIFIHGCMQWRNAKKVKT